MEKLLPCMAGQFYEPSSRASTFCQEPPTRLLDPQEAKSTQQSSQAGLSHDGSLEQRGCSWKGPVFPACLQIAGGTQNGTREGELIQSRQGGL